jgi:hypothetical protein
MVVSVSSTQAVLRCSYPLRPGGLYRVVFATGSGRVEIVAHVRYSRLLPGSPKSFEIALDIPASTADIDRLANLEEAPSEAIRVVGRPALVSDTA